MRKVSWGRVFEEEWLGGWWVKGWRRKWGKGFGGLEGGGREEVGGRTEEETFPDFEEVGLCEVAARC